MKEHYTWLITCIVAYVVNTVDCWDGEGGADVGGEEFP